MKRLQQQQILKDLEKKMVFLVGPRQAGKTWLAKEVAKNFKNSLYLNYDSLDDQKIIDERSWNPEADLIVFDELHKKPEWKNFIKGIYDNKSPQQRILVTGSARLDIFDHIGDSLAGRYFRHRLMPFDYKELCEQNVEYDLVKLISRGGFPEPLLAEEDIDAQRWRQQYINSVLATDVFEFDRVSNLKAIQLLFRLLQKRVGSPLSYSSLARDLSISSATVKKYLEILEAIFVIFQVRPYSQNIARSILKEPKIYFFDTGLVEANDGARFENYIALSLLKNIYIENDYQAKEKTLHYIRTKDGHEVDFAIANAGQLETLIEAKYSEKNFDKNLVYFSEKYKCRASQVVQNLTKPVYKNDLELLRVKDLYLV